MPMASALTFASALTLTLQFLIFAYLYSFHRARFFHYLLVAWGLMSLAKGLHLVRAFVPDLDVMTALINATFFVATSWRRPAAWRSGSTTGSAGATS